MDHGEACAVSRLAYHVRRVLVGAQALVGRRAHAARLGPAGEFNLDHQHRLDPDGAAGMLGWHRGGERARVPAQRREPLLQQPGGPLGEARCDPARVRQAGRGLDPGEQRADLAGPATLARVDSSGVIISPGER